MKNSFNEMCPVVEKTIIFKDKAPWFNSEILRSIMTMKKERKWLKVRTGVARREYQDERKRRNYAY